MIGGLPTSSHSEHDWQVLVGVSTGGVSWYGPHQTGDRLHGQHKGFLNGWCFYDD